MLNEKLCQIGFTDAESTIYLELLKLGPQAVSIIAKRTSLNRTTMYSILKSLEKKGIVSSYKNGCVKFFMANDPNSLIGYIDRKCKTFDYYREQMLMILPKFRNLNSEKHVKPPILAYFDGIEGVKHVMDDTLMAKNEFFDYIAIHKWLEYQTKDIFIRNRIFTIFNKNINLKIIMPDTKEVRAFLDSNFKKENLKNKIAFISDIKNLDMFGNELALYNDKVSIIHLDKGSEYGIILNSKEIYDMHKMIFETMWNQFKQ